MYPGPREASALARPSLWVHTAGGCRRDYSGLLSGPGKSCGSGNGLGSCVSGIPDQVVGFGVTICINSDSGHNNLRESPSAQKGGSREAPPVTVA